MRAIAAFDRTGPSGKVIAIDISKPMLQEAAAKAAQRSIEFAEVDAQALPYPDAAFDSLLCLFGIMFLPARVAALGGFRRVLRPRGRVAATSWDRPERAPFAGLVAEALAEHLPDDRVDLLRPFSLSDPEEIAALYKAAGFDDVAIALRTHTSSFASFDSDFWEPIEAGGGRLGQAYLGLPGHLREAVRNRVLGRLPVRSSSEPFTLEHSAWLVVARAP